MQHSSGVIGQPDTVRAAKHDGGNIAGMYDLERTLGKGHFAVVKSARHVFTGEQVAVKVIDKNKLEEVSRNHLYQEVSSRRRFPVRSGYTVVGKESCRLAGFCGARALPFHSFAGTCPLVTSIEQIELPPLATDRY